MLVPNATHAAVHRSSGKIQTPTFAPSPGTKVPLNPTRRGSPVRFDVLDNCTATVAATKVRKLRAQKFLVPCRFSSVQGHNQSRCRYVMTHHLSLDLSTSELPSFNNSFKFVARPALKPSPSHGTSPSLIRHVFCDYGKRRQKIRLSLHHFDV